MDYTNLCAHARTSQFRERRKAEIAIDGQPRSYVIEQPTMAGPRPTVIMLHGINGTAERSAANGIGPSRAAPRLYRDLSPITRQRLEPFRSRERIASCKRVFS
jgi:predicted alpha/beta-fold hydrolase